MTGIEDGEDESAMNEHAARETVNRCILPFVQQP
jgi:hypothetical protein